MMLTLFFAIDAFGIIPEYLSLIKEYPKKKRLLITLRELSFALLIMILFLYFGAILLKMLGLTRVTVEIAGGIVLFLIAIRLIFPPEDGSSTKLSSYGQEPYVVPFATPLFAGPSVLAVTILYGFRESGDLVILSAIFFSWLLSSIIILGASPLWRWLGEKGMMAIQRLTGLIVALIAVQTFIEGVKDMLRISFHGP